MDTASDMLLYPLSSHIPYIYILNNTMDKKGMYLRPMCMFMRHLPWTRSYVLVHSMLVLYIEVMIIHQNIRVWSNLILYIYNALLTTCPGIKFDVQSVQVVHDARIFLIENHEGVKTRINWLYRGILKYPSFVRHPIHYPSRSNNVALVQWSESTACAHHVTSLARSWLFITGFRRAACEHPACCAVMNIFLRQGISLVNLSGNHRIKRIIRYRPRARHSAWRARFLWKGYVVATSKFNHDMG